MNRGQCIHWNGLRGDDDHCCGAGVNYTQAFGPAMGMFLRLPCVRFQELPAHGRGTYIKAGEPTVLKEFDRRGQVMVPCDKFREPTEEEIQRDRADTDASFERTMVALKVAGQWRVRPKPAQNRREIVECPVCKGRLHLSQSAYNGHVHGRCETEGCVSWME